MNMLIKWIEDAQAMNVAEKREIVTYTKEAFTQLYEEALKLKGDHKNELKIATGKGMIIGAAAVGLGALGKKGYDKFRKRNLEDGERLDEETLESMGIKVFKPVTFKPGEVEILEIDPDGEINITLAQED